MAMRNPDNVPTTYASVDSVQLDDDLIKMLFQPHYTIRPDQSHLDQQRRTLHAQLQAPEELLKRAHDWIIQLNNSPDKLTILFGDPNSPYMRIDPYFMDPVEDEEAQNALDKLIEAIDNNLTGIALQPGEMVFLDNYKVVHGRPAFKARHDGSDRWLKRLNITRDLRKSRSSRMTAESRIIF
jgi:enduracididine beta-hydroxylase